jgi:LPXTG-motif cell wall-anchored protein
MTRRALHAYSAVCDEDCNACGAKRTTTHTYGEFTVTKAAGTLRNGEQTRTCSVCGHVDVQVIPRTGMATGAVVLIGVGVGLVLSVGGFALYWFVFKKRSFAEFLGKK